MEYHILTEPSDKKIILDDMFFEISNRKSSIERSLKNFSKEQGYVVEGKGINFQGDLDEYDLSQLPFPLEEHHILIGAEAGYSSLGFECEGYMTFSEFYGYLEEILPRYVEMTDEIKDLMLDVKKGLGLEDSSAPEWYVSN